MSLQNQQILQSGTSDSVVQLKGKQVGGGIFGTFGIGILFLLLGSLVLFLFYKLRNLESELYECKHSQYHDRDAQRVVDNALRDQKTVEFLRDALYEMDEQELRALEMEENARNQGAAPIDQDQAQSVPPPQPTKSNVCTFDVLGGLIPGLKINLPPSGTPRPMQFPPPNEPHIEEVEAEGPGHHQTKGERRVRFEDIDEDFCDDEDEQHLSKVDVELQEVPDPIGQ